MQWQSLTDSASSQAQPDPTGVNPSYRLSQDAFLLFHTEHNKHSYGIQRHNLHCCSKHSQTQRITAHLCQKAPASVDAAHSLIVPPHDPPNPCVDVLDATRSIAACAVLEAGIKGSHAACKAQ